jgi:hypothetical protein
VVPDIMGVVEDVNDGGSKCGKARGHYREVPVVVDTSYNKKTTKRTCNEIIRHSWIVGKPLDSWIL